LVEMLAIDHVQLAMPKGEEARARAFYADVLGMSEVAKPAALASRGGTWFECGVVQIHLGVEDDFRPAKKAHVALRVVNCNALKGKLKLAGHDVRDDDAIAGITRFFTDDCFGNRIEFVCKD
jgi:catechol 2,3-dioxygenase-like lactoylglutathione lyase family enzyme